MTIDVDLLTYYFVLFRLQKAIADRLRKEKQIYVLLRAVITRAMRISKVETVVVVIAQVRH